MRINQTQNQIINSLQKNKNVKNGKGTDKRSDKIKISKNAINTKVLKKELTGISDVRSEKVNALKKQIENGTYHVSTKALASKLLNRTK